MDMLRELLLFNLILSPLVISKRRHHKKEASSEELTGGLITDLTDDRNLDLSMDEEYEDLRAELLAYHTALSSLTGSRADDGALPSEVAEAVAAEPGNKIDPTDVLETRRSLKTTPCWKLGGICINYKLCQGHRFLTEIPGCKNKLEVCCFTWNKYQTRDLTDKGISNLALPWSIKYEFGGKGPVRSYEMSASKQMSTEYNPNNENSDILAYDLSSTEALKKPQVKLLHSQDNGKKNKETKKLKQALVVVLKNDKM